MAQVLKVTTDTFADILGTVSTLAKVASNGVNTLAAPIDMASTYFTAAKERQIIDTEVLMETYEAKAVMTSANDFQQFEQSLLRQVHADPQRRAGYEAIHAKLTARLAKRHVVAE